MLPYSWEKSPTLGILSTGRLFAAFGSLSSLTFIVRSPKLFKMAENSDYALFIGLSVVLATVIHYTFEKQYLKWNCFVIWISICCMIMVTMVMFVPLSGLDSLFFEESLFSVTTMHQMKDARQLAKNYSHLTRGQLFFYSYVTIDFQKKLSSSISLSIIWRSPFLRQKAALSKRSLSSTGTASANTRSPTPKEGIIPLWLLETAGRLML